MTLYNVYMVDNGIQQLELAEKVLTYFLKLFNDNLYILSEIFNIIMFDFKGNVHLSCLSI